MSCGDDGDGPATPAFENKTWVLTRAVSAECTDPDDNFAENIACDDDFCLKIRFSNGTATITETFFGTTETDTDTYTVSGNILTIDGERVTISVTGNILLATSLDPDPDDGCIETSQFEEE